MYALSSAEFDIRLALGLLDDLKKDKFANGDIYEMPGELLGVWATLDIIISDIQQAHEKLVMIKEVI